MSLSESQLRELKIDFIGWRVIQKMERLPYPDRDAFLPLAERSALYGSLNGVRSAWSRAAKELADEGIIRLHVPPPAPTPIDRINDDKRGFGQVQVSPPVLTPLCDIFGSLFNAQERPERRDFEW